MSKKLFVNLSVLLLSCAGSFAVTKDQTPVDYVDPWIESAKSRYFFFNTASRPFGMVNLSPDTALKSMWRSGYRYNDTTTYGMTHTRCWQTAGLLVIPTMGVDPCKGQEAWKSEFSHDDEVVQAGYHKLHLDKYDVDVELTSTARVGFHRYTFNQAGDVPERDPKDWQLLSSNDGENWTTLDARKGELWSQRQETRTFTVSNKTAYRFYRLNITAVRDFKNANSVQIAEIEFQK